MSDERCPQCNGYRGLPRILHDQDPPQECAHPFHTETPVEVAPDPEPQPAPQAQPPAPQQSVPKPVCPYCGVEGKLFAQSTNFGQIDVMVVRCGNNECRKVLFGFQPLQFQMMPPQTMPPGRVQ